MDWPKLYAHLTTLLHRMGGKRRLQKADAQDAAHDVAVRLLERERRQPDGLDRPEHYAGRALRNALIDVFRNQGCERARALPTGPDPAESEGGGDEGRGVDRMLAALEHEGLLAKLAPSERAVVRAYLERDALDAPATPAERQRVSRIFRRLQALAMPAEAEAIPALARKGRR